MEIGTNWETVETGEYVQSVEVAGILATDNPIVDVVLDALKDTALSQLEAWSCVSKIETSDGSITVTCLEKAPTVATGHCPTFLMARLPLQYMQLVCGLPDQRLAKPASCIILKTASRGRQYRLPICN